MKIKEILKESPTDLVARFYKEASSDFDKTHNSDNAKYKELNSEYYKENFGEWYEHETVPVFTAPVSKSHPVYNNKPKQGKQQSPGYRGLQFALAAAGLPYNKNVKFYDPNTIAISSSFADGGTAARK